MAIKLYKSQLTPTTQSSNVENKAFVSMAEAGSIGKAWKGMVRSGEQLYAKHQDIKTDNEILERTKEVMNGGENFEGLSTTKIQASEMNDPDAAGKLYNDQWQSIFDNVNGSLSGKMAQRKFKNWMTQQNIKDVNAIKAASTTNMINTQRVNTLDQVETLKKSIIYGSDLESRIAAKELSDNLGSKKYSEIFGNTLNKIKKDTETEIAYFQYKNVPLDQQEAALEKAKKDKRIPNDGKYSIDALTTEFSSKKSSTNYKNINDINQTEKNVEMGFTVNEEEFANMIKIATDTGDEKSLIKLEKIQRDYPIYQQLALMSVSEIENRKNILTEYKNTKEGGMDLNTANNLEITTKYLAALTSSLDKDQLMAANDRGIVTINEIGFDKLLSTGNINDFKNSVTNRIADAKTVAGHYKRPVKFFTENEISSIQNAYESANTPKQIIDLSTSLVQAFGFDSDTAFKQISKDNTFLAHIGGLTMMNNGVPGANTKLATQGYLISKNNPELSKMFKLKDAEISAKIDDYNKTFLENPDTFNNIKETANYIYQAQLFNKGKSSDDFNVNDYEKAFQMAAGGSTIAKFGFDKKMGGFDKNSRGNTVHIPPWLENGKFDDIEKMLNDDAKLVTLASSNGKDPIDINGNTVKNIFENQNPFFVSVGNGKYKIAQGENPIVFGGEPEYLMNTDGGFFIIDLNKIKSDIITKFN